MTILEAKERVALKHSYANWEDLIYSNESTLDTYIDEVILLYHKSQKNL